MKLRKKLATIALGATVLTAAPLVFMPVAAYACSDTQTSCDDDSGGGGGGGGDTGDGGGGGGSEIVADTGDWDATSIPVYSLPDVVIIGQREPQPETPVNPSIVSSGGGSDGGGTSATVWSQGKKEERRTDCLQNQLGVPVQMTQNITYSVSYQVSANLSAAAAGVLTATLGVQLNTTYSRSSGIDVTLQPGQGVALFVEYETDVYMINTMDLFGNVSTEFVNVTAPTGNVAVRNC